MTRSNGKAAYSLTLILAAASVACGDSDEPGRDASAGNPDGAANVDAGETSDAGLGDGAENPDSGTSTTTACPLDERSRALVENTVDGVVSGAGLVALHASPLEAAYVLALPGTDVFFQNYAFLVEACSGPSEFVPFCFGMGDDQGFYAQHDLCTRLRCESADAALYDSWLTMKPNTDPEMRHPFAYDTTDPMGAGLSTPNPFVTWRADLSVPDEARVTASLDWNLTITATGAEAIDGRFTGTVSAERDASGGISVETALRFPNIAADAELVVTASVGADHSVLGSIAHDGVLLGTVAASEAGPAIVRIEWVDPCR